ncbi:MAG: WxcM-like domain-containing protein [Patescibacteria group bacterium]|jgi:uncharacterized RmlC-like cupin family protein
MARKKFGDDPMDFLSKPTQSFMETTFDLPQRRNDEKPGRTLKVLFDKRAPLAPKFKCRFVYCVTLDTKGNKTGCHYHKRKHEMLFCTNGSVKVIRCGKCYRHSTNLNASEHQAVYIEPGVIHQVIACTDGATVVVIASAPNSCNDEFETEFPNSDKIS